MAPAGLRRPPALMISGGFPRVGSRGVNRRGVTLSMERCRPGRQEGPQPAVILEPGRWNRPLLRGCWGQGSLPVAKALGLQDQLQEVQGQGGHRHPPPPSLPPPSVPLAHLTLPPTSWTSTAPPASQLCRALPSSPVWPSCLPPPGERVWLQTPGLSVTRVPSVSRLCGLCLAEQWPCLPPLSSFAFEG